MKYKFIYILFISGIIFSGSGLQAQDGEKIYRFLNLPTSTRINALGGNNVSLVENDPSIVFHNPSLLGSEMDMNLSVSYMSYISDISVGNAIFAKSLSDISAFSFGVNYFDYGKFNETSAENEISGDFGAKDIALNGTYSRDLSDRWRGGVTAKFIYSGYESYSSTGIGFDAGLSYYNPEREASFGIVLKNVGAQLSSYNEERVAFPWDVQVGGSKKLGHAPIRVSLTGVYLTQWKFERVNPANGLEPDGSGFFDILVKHLVFGVDIIPSENFWIAVGFNPKTRADMKILEGNQWGGWNAGAGLRIKKFNVGFSFSPYHTGATAYHFTIGMDLSKF